MLTLIGRYKVWKVVNNYIKYYNQHTDRYVQKIPFKKIKIVNLTKCKDSYAFCSNEFGKRSGMYLKLHYLAISDFAIKEEKKNKELFENTIGHEVAHYICNEFYRIDYTEVNNHDLPQFIEVCDILKIVNREEKIINRFND